MGQKGLLGSFEELVLLAVAHDEGKAYGMTVRRQIETRSGRNVTLGAVYATLERLCAKEYLESWTAQSTTVGRGRARRYYRLSPEGVQALLRAEEVHRQMWEGLDLDPLLQGNGRQP